MRKARIFNYYNKRSHKGNEKNYRAYTLRAQAKSIISLDARYFLRENKRYTPLFKLNLDNKAEEFRFFITIFQLYN
ncbi:MAG: hypothetical protein QNK36_02160, partial [Colwellia sp.]|nr:hypothetical protein [Colwellia sp.]